MRVLVADAFEESGLRGLAAEGCEVVYAPELKDASLAAAIRESDADVLVVRSTRVAAEMLDAGHLSLIVRAGAGVNTIDVAGAAARGIYVSNCPGKNAIAVAELAFGLILSLDRRIPDNVVELRAGRWNKKEYSSAPGLFGCTLGLLGLGAIGAEMVRRAQGFGMHVVAWDHRYGAADRPFSEEDVRLAGLELMHRDLRVELAPSPEAVAARCDVLSLHLSLVPATRGIVNAEVLECLKPGAFLINTARSELVDHEALEAAIRTRGLRVGFDVFEREPTTAVGAFEDPVVHMPGVYGTHHIGASTRQAQEAIAAETVRIIRCYMRTGKVPNVVNLCTRTPATHTLVVRHHDRPGVLAHVLEHLSTNQINVQEMENIIFDGAKAAVARINLDGAPPASLLETIRSGDPHILDLYLVQLAG